LALLKMKAWISVMLDPFKPFAIAGTSFAVSNNGGLFCALFVKYRDNLYPEAFQGWGNS
jgi:hypothetical protein